jgi:hypothetical protein
LAGYFKDVCFKRRLFQKRFVSEEVCFKDKEKSNMWLKTPDAKQRSLLPESLGYSRYYEHDGALRAYANRAMLVALLSVPTVFLSVAFAAYVRLEPPTVIRLDGAGAALPVNQKTAPAASAIGKSQKENNEPGDFEKKAYVRLFLERYLNFSPGTVDQNWSDGLNMMTANLRRSALAAIEKDNRAGRIADDQITSVFHLRALEIARDDPLSFTAFGVKDVHRVHEHQETSDHMVGEIHLRLIAERRSEENPSGLLIADYRERLIEGERREAVVQATSLGPAN